MPPEMDHQPVDRRRFLRRTTAAALSLTASSYAAVPGSLEAIRVAFLGCGARAQAHIHLVNKLAQETGTVRPVAVCDVWDGLEEDYDHHYGTTTTRRRYSQGLYPSARKCGLDPSRSPFVVKDYRQLLDRPDIDAVCIATPDHWHARMTLDALQAGKDVFVETPMTRTAAEAVAVLDTMRATNRVLTVGVPSLTDPSWRLAAEVVKSGKIGQPAQLCAGVYRNDPRGEWRYYRVVESMNPRTVDWNLFLGHRFEVAGVPIGPHPKDCPFDSTRFAQWRCESRFSDGPFSDLFLHPVSRLLAATGLRFPRRVTGAGGLFQLQDGRDIPDVATLVADFPEGCQLVITGSTLSAYPCEEVIRGRRGTVKFVRGGIQVLTDEPGQGASLPTRLERSLDPRETLTADLPKNETETLWRNFLDCVRRRDRATIGSMELGAAGSVVVSLAAQSLREGRTVTWDAERRVDC